MEEVQRPIFPGGLAHMACVWVVQSEYLIAAGAAEAQERSAQHRAAGGRGSVSTGAGPQRGLLAGRPAEVAQLAAEPPRGRGAPDTPAAAAAQRGLLCGDRAQPAARQPARPGSPARPALR